MTDEIIMYIITGLAGTVAFFFVRWMNDINDQIEKNRKAVEKITERVTSMEKSEVNINDCYTRHVRIQQNFERDRYRLGRLEEKIDLQSPHPVKNRYRDEDDVDHRY